MDEQNCEEANWIETRRSGIGASEAAATVGKSPYTNNIILWEEKTGRRKAKDYSDNTMVQYGKNAEPHIRALFALDHPELKVEYLPYDLIKNPEHEFILATLDGRLTDENGRKGILEIKTTEIINPSQWKKWDGMIPENYYIQVLHQLMTTGWEFAILTAQIKYKRNEEIRKETKEYRIERKEVEDEIDYLMKYEKQFWIYVTTDERPPLILPMIGV